ncbi:MAG: dihydrofolate reductase [Acidimicrobiia bacterium]|nr:dihydrofolate reductase [Acidimicrobiia bacterium]
MSKVIATLTTSVDGYYTGPDDGPGNGLGTGGERLHYWVMGGPWTYKTDRDPNDSMSDVDKEFYESLTEGMGAGICGRGMYDSAGAWGGTNPFDGTLWVVTHRPEDAPDPDTGFRFVNGLDNAMEEATAAADGKGIAIGGGGDVIRQALTAGYVDVLGISTAPVVLGRGKQLFDGFDQDLDLEIQDVFSSQYATHTIYKVKK